MNATTSTLLAFILLCAAGCGKEDSAAKATGGGGGPGQKADDKPKVSRPSGVFGVRDQTAHRLILRDIGLACQTENVGALPKNLEELKKIVRDAPRAKKALDEGVFVMATNARVAGDSLFIYERDADANGNRLVLMGDGTVHKKSAEEFAALK